MYGWQAGCTHPTGMLSCYNMWSLFDHHIIYLCSKDIYCFVGLDTMNGAFECPCESCKELFNCFTLWEQHRLWHHDSSQKYQCVKCGLLFTRAIKNHVRVRKECIFILTDIYRMVIKHITATKEHSNTTLVIWNSVVWCTKEYHWPFIFLITFSAM